MKLHSFLIGLSLEVLLFADVMAQDPVQIQFLTDPVLVQTGSAAVFTAQTVSEVFTMTWLYQGVNTLGVWTGGSQSLNAVPQFQGRVTITATTLQIRGAELRDAGNYTVEVTPTAATGLRVNSRSIQLRVFDAVAGVSLSGPSVAVEGTNVSLRCTGTAGTDTTVRWGKDGAAISAGSRITISAGWLVINPIRLGDTGEYTCTVSNLVSARNATQNLTVYYRVAGVSLFVPSVAVEGKNVSLSCTQTAGTDTSVLWSKDGSTIVADSRITISAGSLVINPARRADTGEYTCTVTNLVSAGSATQSLTVNYGPDTPVLTRSVPKECVGAGNVGVGQAVRLTCTSESLPPAQFTWQHNGQAVTFSQPGSGVLNIQTFSTTDSGKYSCVARNAVTAGTSEQTTDLAIVDVCLSAGEVAAIVVCSFLLLILIIVAILCLVRWRRVKQRNKETVDLQKILPPDPPPRDPRNLGQGPHPPLHQSSTHAQRRDPFYAVPPEHHGNPQTQMPNGRHYSNLHQQNGRTHTNRLAHNDIQHTNSYPHNGLDNPDFTHTASQNANAHPNAQLQNPNIVIQTGTAQGNAQPQTVQVTLNTLPNTAQQNNNAQMPTIHVNVGSNPVNGQQTQQDVSASTTNHVPLQNQQNQITTRQQHANPSNQVEQYYPSGPLMNGQPDTSNQTQPRLISTGHTHYNRDNTAQRNANTQTYQQERVSNARSVHNVPADRNTATRDASTAGSSSQHQMPWDRLRGTPAYPNSTLQRGQALPDFTSDYTENTTQPPIRQARTPNRSQPGPRGQGTTRSRVPPRQEVSVDRQTQTRSVAPGTNHQGQSSQSAAQLEATQQTRRSPRAQRESTQQNIRGLTSSHTTPRQEVVRSNNPQALPLMSHQSPTGRTAVSQGSVTQQRLIAPQATDARALADPNHLPQAHTAQQHRAAQVQTIPRGPGTQAQPGVRGANQPRQAGTAPARYPAAQPTPNNLTQAALRDHTHKAQTFQNRNQQTKAALLHPGPQTRAAEHPPIPPPVIPLAQFQTLPQERSQHRSPARGPQPPKPPVNVPLAQRHVVQQQHREQRHAATMHTHHHHPPGNAHRQAHTHGHPTHATHPRQQQAHRGGPR
ncbi:uncharacterized protein LOC142999088 isoform X2 [Genypterus blacodes]|uniref:uncharacterized protein LOC142999088 isoform X2 n=1 Tax=Genypterus blacodes TaxID=154954 RepID=UPI003F76E290